jgi:hemoglobin-like flavoprotein
MDSQIVTEKGVGLFFPTWRERYRQKMLRVDLLQSSFEQVLGQKEAFAETFYQRLFMLYPQTRQLFAHTNMKHQQNVLMAALSTVISSLKNAEQEKLASILKELGRRHASYGVRPEHYPMVATALLETFALYLGGAWTRELNDAWTEAYGAIVALMSPQSTTEGGMPSGFMSRLIARLTRA